MENVTHQTNDIFRADENTSTILSSKGTFQVFVNPAKGGSSVALGGDVFLFVKILRSSGQI